MSGDHSPEQGHVPLRGVGAAFAVRGLSARILFRGHCPDQGSTTNAASLFYVGLSGHPNSLISIPQALSGIVDNSAELDSLYLFLREEKKSL